MKNTSKAGLRLALAAVLLLVVSMSMQAGHQNPPAVAAIECLSPNPGVTVQSTNSISFSWDAVSGASGYKVWYYRAGDNYTHPESTTGSTGITFSGLPQGNYQFYFATVCSGGLSDYIIIDILM